MRKKSIVNALINCLEATIYFHESPEFTYNKKYHYIDFYSDHFLFFVDGDQNEYLRYYKQVWKLEIKK